MVALISWLSARSLEQALKDLREINLNLDKLVEQKTQELAATLSREIMLAGRNQAILDSIADGVIVFDANHKALLANPALSRFTGIPLESLKGMQLPDFVKTEAVDPSNQGVILGVIEHPEKVEEGVRVEWGRRTLSLSAARVLGETSNANFGSVAVFRDITKEAELDKMKQTFVAVVSHELRTPLNAIMGYSEMIKEAFYGPVNEKQAAASERIIVNTNRMLAMVGDLLDEAQLKAGKLSIKNETFKTDSLLKTMRVTMDKIITDKGITLTDELDPGMPETIIGDVQRLQQIIVNLVNNAAKFTEQGGIRVGIKREGTDQWKIEIADTGMGIPEKDLPYIFDTFRQVEETTKRKHGGFGLGLAIVKQLVELMQGTITVRSELQKGSTFTITLPLLQK
jgi:PAS domain S-box-containing protein